MSFKNEVILTIRDIRQFAFKVPTNKHLRVGWAFVMSAWIGFFAVAVWAITLSH